MAGAGGSWVLFDPRAIMLADSEQHHAPTAAASLTSNGLGIRVSLRLAPPPAASYVQVTTDDRLYGGEPTVVAADGDLLRIHMVVVAPADESHSDYPYNMFVYRAHPERPSLLLLPPIPDEWQWMGCWGRHSGIVRGGAAGEFLAVDLQRSDDMVPELLRFSSSAGGGGQWELRQLRNPGADGLDLRCWNDDAVFCSGELVCWADYHQGVLLCDVAADDPDLRFVPFPGLDVWRDFTNGRGAPDRFRAAAVGVDGVLRFVDVDNGRFRHAAGKSGCTVTTWALSTPAAAPGWEEEHTLQLADLWSRPEYRRSPLPRRTPEYPVFDWDEVHVLHFVLRESYRSTEQWTVTVDMAEGSMRSYEMHQIAIDEEPRARVRDSPSISSEVCRYVSP